MTRTLRLLGGYHWLEQVWAAFTEATQELARAVGVPLCVEGCGLCCVTNTPSALGIEVKRAASWLLGRPVAEREQVLDQIATWLVRPVLEVAPPGVPALGVRSPRLGPGLVPRADLLACVRGRCPLLGDDLRCLVYEVRPLGCRAYGVTHLPDRFCKRPRGLGETADGRCVYGGPGLLRLKTLVAGLRRALRGDPTLGRSALFPTALYAELRPHDLALLAPRIPTARLAGGDDDPAHLWDEREDLPIIGSIIDCLAGVRERAGMH